MSGAIAQMAASHASNAYEVPGGGAAFTQSVGGRSRRHTKKAGRRHHKKTAGRRYRKSRK